MKTAVAKQSRKVRAAEVKAWFGKSRKSKLGQEHYDEIAAYLNRLRWPSDPSSVSDDPHRETSEISNDFWDFHAVTKASKMLLDSVPAMLSHWNGQRSTPETREGCEAIKALGDALSAAMHYIEWPFGRYEPQTGQKRPKDWHTYSIIIARLIVRTLIDAGEAAPGITHNSLVVQVTHSALIRLEVPNLAMLTPDAIGAHLARWNKKYGLTPKGIAALVTK